MQTRPEVEFLCQPNAVEKKTKGKCITTTKTIVKAVEANNHPTTNHAPVPTATSPVTSSLVLLLPTAPEQTYPCACQ